MEEYAVYDEQTEMKSERNKLINVQCQSMSFVE